MSHGDRPLLLANAWDHASGAALAARGFAAIGTTSLGVAAAAGLPRRSRGHPRADPGPRPRPGPSPGAGQLGRRGRLRRRPGGGRRAGGRALDAGAAGINLEDGRPDGSLVPTARQCEVITAVKERAPELFVNARTDTHWVTLGSPSGPLPGTVERAEAYQGAGADGVFVPGVGDAGEIGALVRALDVPLNVLFTPGGRTFEELADLGVGRVSCGSLLYRAALHRAVEPAWGIGHPGAPEPGIPGYARTAALAEAFTGRH
ncbi:isocitrate lyase/phosphoenolpyruvate mutase family protein [Streptomyces meridianus]|uniref:Isocitrate lyase/phosphoenolpyruvate mutase family protein n=1 Tax=Streptomyces meridianus TaxID=2938945 RepID=A0ABT0X4S0_9ACTN|nr:isocitrate lyase/phosphoenolpyruvate mutase family protein [Streptomyces meridianus]MCM2577540.1 isocitrate lyase/phosphoenolpyruvate mutase family protein [Streptomyces meridianus]